jgi:hypothetical protein
MSKYNLHIYVTTPIVETSSAGSTGIFHSDNLDHVGLGLGMLRVLRHGNAVGAVPPAVVVGIFAYIIYR